MPKVSYERQTLKAFFFVDVTSVGYTLGAGGARMHGLGWTREQLAFVFKLSAVGVRTMEHLGTTLVKSMESRWALLGLSKTLENLTPEIAAYIEQEEAALG